jgi:hypothetical protein
VQLVAEVARGGLGGGALAGVVAAEPVRVVQVGQVPPTRARGVAALDEPAANARAANNASIAWSLRSGLE